MAEDSIRLLVVEDHHLVRKALVTLLSGIEGFEIVGEAADGDEAIAEYGRCRPDITLIDLRLPGTSGVEVVESIRLEFAEARFIVLTTYDGEEEVYRALRAGVRSYLLKGATLEELVGTIRLVHEGRSHVPPEIFERLIRRLGSQDFTLREKQVLKEIVMGRSNKDIAATLGISEATVKAHMNGLLDKLGVTDRTQAAMAAIVRGIVALEPSANKKSETRSDKRQTI